MMFRNKRRTNRGGHRCLVVWPKRLPGWANSSRLDLTVKC
jgi:hypothetical protein